MTITVRELIRNPHLKTKVLAGISGLEREITWAHVCELQDPTPWLSGGELIMTTGLAIPRIAQQQEAYLQCLVQAGVSGLAIAEDMYAPELTNPLLAEADRRSFPVLLTAYEVPWLAITRTVADANTHKEHARVLQTLRVYEIARQVMHNRSPAEIMRKLSVVINCTLHVVDPLNRKLLFSDDELQQNTDDLHIPKEILEHIRPIDTPGLPTVYPIKRKGNTALQITIPASRPVILIAVTRSNVYPDNLILRHIATILGMVIEKDTAMHERQRRIGTELFSGLIDGRLAIESANLLLGEHKLEEEPRCIVACSAGTQSFEHEWLHFQLSVKGIPNLLTRRGKTLFALLSFNDETISTLQAEVPANVRLGISDSLECPSRTPEAFQEAMWALKAAEKNERNIVYYSEEQPVSPFLPRNRNEARELVEQIIGDLLAYDKKNNSQLALTLYIYLSENRSWQAASKKLHIHKQTLVYRISRIEQMTGRRLNITKNVAELWFALQSAMMLGLLPDFFRDFGEAQDFIESVSLESREKP